MKLQLAACKASPEYSQLFGPRLLIQFIRSSPKRVHSFPYNGSWWLWNTGASQKADVPPLGSWRSCLIVAMILCFEVVVSAGKVWENSPYPNVVGPVIVAGALIQAVLFPIHLFPSWRISSLSAGGETSVCVLPSAGIAQHCHLYSSIVFPTFVPVLLCVI